MDELDIKRERDVENVQDQKQAKIDVWIEERLEELVFDFIETVEDEFNQFCNDEYNKYGDE